MLIQLALGLVLTAGDPAPIRISDKGSSQTPQLAEAGPKTAARRTTDSSLDDRTTASAAVAAPTVAARPIASTKRALKVTKVAVQSVEQVVEHVVGDDKIPVDTSEVASSCDCCNHRNGCCYPSPCKEWLFGRCDMPQHMAYPPQMHGHYYFRPYNYSHLSLQRDFVSSFGGDPRNPYGNKVFTDVYARLLEEEAAAKSQPKLEGLPAPEKRPK